MRTQVLPKTLVAGLSVFVCALTAVLAAQTAQPARALDPPYLAGFPSVDAVKLAVRGSDPTDTTARQVAILYKFEQLVLRMEKLPGRSPNSETQDERRLSLMFHSAYYELSLTYARAPNAKAIDQLVAKYSADAALTNQMLGLLAPATLTEYGKLDAAASAQAQASMQASIDLFHRKCQLRHQHARTGGGHCRRTGRSCGAAIRHTGSAGWTADVRHIRRWRWVAGRVQTDGCHPGLR
jgi:hypothetical protein